MKGKGKSNEGASEHPEYPWEPEMDAEFDDPGAGAETILKQPLPEASSIDLNDNSPDTAAQTAVVLQNPSKTERAAHEVSAHWHKPTGSFVFKLLTLYMNLDSSCTGTEATYKGQQIDVSQQRYKSW